MVRPFIEFDCHLFSRTLKIKKTKLVKVIPKTGEIHFSVRHGCITPLYRYRFLESGLQKPSDKFLESDYK